MITATTSPVVFRGPILIASATTTLLIPFLCAISTQTLICIGLLGLGLFITVRDVAFRLEGHARQQLARALDSVVVDDVLRSTFDPETGWIATLVSTLVGNASMYALPMTPEHRIRLVQACLWTSEAQTRSFFMEPGGVKEILPVSFRQWLDGPLEKEIKASPPIEKVTYHIHDNTDDGIEASEASDDETNDRYLSERVSSSEKDASQATSSPRGVANFLHPTLSKLPRETRIFQSSAQAMGSIIKDMTVHAIKKAAQNVPDSVLHTAGLAAAAGCLLHLRSSPRVRRIVSGAIEGTAVFTLASVAIGAIAALLAKHRLELTEPRTGVYTGPTSRSAPPSNQPKSAVISAIVKIIGRGISENWKGSIAIIVMLLFGLAKDPRSRLRAS